MKVFEHTQSQVHSNLKALLAVFLAAGLVFGSTQFGFADDGDLDPTFGTGGYTSTDINNNDDYGSNVALQADGKIVVVGTSYKETDPDLVIARYNSDGSTDTSFGTNGLVITDIANEWNNGGDFIIQPDGKIIVISNMDRSYPINDQFALVRYNSDGSLDNTFGTDGIMVQEIGNDDTSAKGIALQNDGKIVIVGSVLTGSYYDATILRYNTDGTLDNAFGTNGIVITVVNGFGDWFSNVAIFQDGTILTVGSSHNGNDYDVLLARYSSNGSLDSTFGSDGIVTTDLLDWSNRGISLALAPFGKILVTGYTLMNGGVRAVAIYRYDSDGSLDTTFSTSGKQYIHICDDDNWPNDLINQPDGKLLITGTCQNGDSGADLFLIRFTKEGSLDDTFGTYGSIIQDFSDSDGGEGMVMLPNGDTLITGTVNNGTDADIFLGRYLFDYDLDAYNTFLPIMLTN